MPPDIIWWLSIEGAPFKVTVYLLHKLKLHWGGEAFWSLKGGKAEEKKLRLCGQNIFNKKTKKLCLNALLLLMCLLCCRINSWRCFKVALAHCIDSQHSSSSIVEEWKLKLPPAWFHIWSRCDGPLAWASINERQTKRGENSPHDYQGGMDPPLNREPSGREKGVRVQPVLNV